MNDNRENSIIENDNDDFLLSAENLINIINNISEIKTEEDLNVSDLFQMQVLTSIIIGLLPYKMKKNQEDIQCRMDTLEKKMNDIFLILKDLVKIQNKKMEEK